MKTFFYICAFLSLWTGVFFWLQQPKTSFEDLMGKGSPYWEWVQTSEDAARLKLYKGLYDRNFPHASLSAAARIPHTIHFIWVGPRPFPDKSIKNVLSWQQHHPQWKIKLWTDRPRHLPIHGIEECLIEADRFPIVSSYVEKTANYGEKSDLLRYEILFREGGIYADHDVICFQSFQPLHDHTDFITVLEKPHRDEGFDSSIVPAICLIASAPHHPIMRAALDNVVGCWDAVETQYADRPIQRVVNRTFRSFGEAVRTHIGQSGTTDLCLPSSFLFAEEIFSHRALRKLKKQNLVFGSHSWDIQWIRQEDGIADEIYEHIEKNFRQQKIAKRELHAIERKIPIVSASSVLLFLAALLIKRKKGNPIGSTIS